jgi:hypothetical protein
MHSNGPLPPSKRSERCELCYKQLASDEHFLGHYPCRYLGVLGIYTKWRATMLQIDQWEALQPQMKRRHTNVSQITDIVQHWGLQWVSPQGHSCELLWDRVVRCARQLDVLVWPTGDKLEWGHWVTSPWSRSKNIHQGGSMLKDVTNWRRSKMEYIMSRGNLDVMDVYVAWQRVRCDWNPWWC